MPKLNQNEIKRRLAKLNPAWKRINKHSIDMIERSFTFNTFLATIAFVNAVALIAEQENHHPDIHIHYNKIRIIVWTHSISGLSENDFILAAKIDIL